MGSNLKIGVTGGIGSGKSVVCRIFKILGIPIYDADSRARYILNNDPNLRNQIISLFGEDAYTEGGLNNQWIASHVFSDEGKLQNLNSLIHPKVGQDFDLWQKHSSAPYVIKEAALLYEANSFKELDKIVVVTAPEELRIERVLKRDSHRTKEQVQDILKRQWPEERKIGKADYLITNDDKHMVVPQVIDLNNKLLEISRNDRVY